MKNLTPPGNLPLVDVLVPTFNSARNLEECLSSVRRYIPVRQLFVVDRHSTDDTRAIAGRFGAQVHLEEVGLGYARTLLISLAETENVLFVDGDVILRRPDFYEQALRELGRARTGAVVGASVGHRFLYGLPFGLTLLPRAWARRVEVPRETQGEETWYFRKQLRRERLRIGYVPDAMEHRSVYRVRNWPEWQGAQLRLSAGFSPYELAFSFAVILMIHLNSRRVRNVAYTPVFYLKLLRGFLAPQRWRVLDRRTVRPT